MKVSVIIPCYNYGKYLDECFSNLQAQSYENWEAILVDDGSTDHTMETVRSWQAHEPRIQYFYQPNSGVSTARNLGLTKANGELIQFLDADDLLSRDKIRLQVEYLAAHPEVDLCYTENHYFEDGIPEVHYPDQEFLGRDWMIRFSGKHAFAVEQLIRNNLAVVSSPVLRKSLAGIAGFFPEDISHTEDWQYWIQCVFAGATIHYLRNPEAFTLIRVHRGSVSQQTQTMRYGELNLRTWLNHQLQEAYFLNESEKSSLRVLNGNKKRQLFKYIMYHGPLTSISHLIKMASLYDWPTVISFYFKAINFRRKTINKVHAANRSHHPIQRKDARIA
ncbi:glycosyltransferase family 2 protein [Algoriphagus aestuariicola]|jgi:glycosyltransferase involved in cell wall biosynthesis|uniref:Glycosyltransferase family 2 protein n=1 Tax=Algoriphagus aestuariicola TaxID=1852016 RepID=A0ABS3BRJ8_9BACT|nr:glycosyltransferase family 2 protein [Algoriphagus aestuariicola]MBN7801469.1 glycosyltransferase family 2 protein [Algoriphagus aestuariicola]